MLLAKYVGGSILNLVKCYLCFTDVFFISVVYVKNPKTKSFILSVSSVLTEKSVDRIETNFAISCNFTEGQNLSAWFQSSHFSYIKQLLPQNMHFKPSIKNIVNYSFKTAAPKIYLNIFLKCIFT